MTDFQPWIGRTQQATDHISARLLTQFRATLEGQLWEHAAVPLGIHWCLAPVVEPISKLGEDGHPARTAQQDSFQPPIPLPSRMWAGGSLQFLAPFDPKQSVTRHSEIESIKEKQGNSGPLFIVQIAHRFENGGQVKLQEKQSLIYKPARQKGDGPEYCPGQGGIDPVTMFRYSAMTFNGHRIHYDADYARQVEHYPAIVVHGPLQATILLNHAAKVLGRMPKSFTYRGLAPLFANEDWEIDGKEKTLWIVGPKRRKTTTAEFS